MPHRILFRYRNAVALAALLGATVTAAAFAAPQGESKPLDNDDKPLTFHLHTGGPSAVTKDHVPAKAIESPPAQFPQDVLYEAKYAYDDVRVRVGKDGKASYKISTGSGSKAVDAIVLGSLANWKWEPARSWGEPVEESFVFRFDLDTGLAQDQAAAASAARPGDTPVAFVKMAEPDLSQIYPPTLKGSTAVSDRGIETTAPLVHNAVVTFWVTPEGKPRLIRIVRSSGVEDVDTKLIEAILASKFRPAVRDGKPIAASVEHTFVLGRN